MKPETKENENQATLPECEDFAIAKHQVTIKEVVTKRNKAKEDIEKIITDFIEETGVIPEIKTEIDVMEAVGGTQQLTSFRIEIGIKL